MVMDVAFDLLYFKEAMEGAFEQCPECFKHVPNTPTFRTIFCSERFEQWYIIRYAVPGAWYQVAPGAWAAFLYDIKATQATSESHAVVKQVFAACSLDVEGETSWPRVD